MANYGILRRDQVSEADQKHLKKGWEIGRWWALTDAEGNLKCETSNPSEIAQFYEEGDKVYRTYRREQKKAIETDILDYYSAEDIAAIQQNYKEMMDDD